MGEKSRGNFRQGLCMKFDCANRDEKCDVCIRFSEYEEGGGDAQDQIDE